MPCQKPINGVNYAVGYSFTLSMIGVVWWPSGGPMRKEREGGRGGEGRGGKGKRS